jgi:antitoxin component YwqK of YwqJK toxin-antitoxin module
MEHPERYLNSTQMCFFAFIYKVSRPNPGCFFLLALLFASCNHHNEYQEEKIIPKTVPALYLDKSDNLLNKHEDTIFYRGHFYSGYIYSIFPTGDTEFVHSVFNGVEEGLQRTWYHTGQMAEERFYINGKKEGQHLSWWPDGKMKLSFHFLHDEYDGEFLEWYPSGKLCKQFHYVNGREEGSERLWWDNGTVRANYVIRNGKKYGLIGLKTCTNPYDSINSK